MNISLKEIFRIAAVSAVAILVISCKGKIAEIDPENMADKPIQTLDGMFAVQTSNGRVQMRMEAKIMEHYETDTASWDAFPKGLSVYGYNEEGLLETLLLSDNARHIIRKKGRSEEESWEAFGNVVIHNVIKQETMETDTLYWDQSRKEIYTDCYVKMYSPSGFMQGYGMRSDDRARNSILMKPFNSYGYTVQDSTAVIIDSVNFIGPFPKK